MQNIADATAYNNSSLSAVGGKIEITVVAPPFTDPNAVAEAIDDYVRGAIDRGTLRAR
jgi:hypothetical protein